MPDTLYMLSHSLSLLSNALEVLVPKECLVCRRPLRRNSLCFRCTPMIPPLTDALRTSCRCCFGPLTNHSGERPEICEACLLFPTEFQQMRFIWSYSGLARDFIRAMKYRPSVALARYGGALLAEVVPTLFSCIDWNLIVPVPSSHQTYRKRLFNPCDEVARAVATTALDATLVPLLMHDRRRKPQALSSPAERLRGLRKLFQVRTYPQLKGAKVLLIEDVVTTGATIAAAAHALRAAGAHSVDVLALARTPVWPRFRKRLSQLFST